MQRIPHHTTETSIFARPLWSLTLLCCQCPVTVLVLSVLAAAISLYWAYGHLGLKMSRLDLINPKSSFNQLWLDYIDEFGDSNEVVVVVEGKANSDVVAVLEHLTEEIGEFPDFYQDILHGVDLSAIRRKGLHYIPLEDLQKIQQFVSQSLAQLDPGNLSPMSADPRSNARNNDTDGLMDNAANLLTALSQSKITDEGMNYFLFPAKDGIIGFVLLRLIHIDKTQFSQGSESIEKLRNIIGLVRAEHPSLQIGLTGMPILEYDEMALSNDAMTKATILALAGVCIIFMAGFGSLRHPLLAVFALMLAFAWTMGYITLAVGHLNILSIAFGAMLIGLGTDFSVHYLGKYLDLRRNGWNVTESLCQSAELVGPGILTGALTTSAAFYAASFAEFTGVAELGTIAGGGILFCVTATLTTLPALIILITPTAPGRNAPSGSLLDIRPALAPVYVFPKITLILFAVGFGYLSFGIPKVWYDHNLLNLQPEGLESVELEQRLLEMDVDQGGKNVWFALSIAETKDELLERKKLFEQKYPELKTEEIVSLFPEADPERNRVIQSLAGMLQNMPDQLPPMVDPELFMQLQSLKAMATAEPPTVDDLPVPLVIRFVGRHGKHLMRIYTTANIWDMDEMEKFVKAVRAIDPDATGSPLQTYESSLQMQQGFITAAYYALAVVLFLTWLDFRSITASLAALLPMFLGFSMMFGIIGLLDLPLNPANMIVLPLVIGISIDHGVHIIHDFRYRRYKRYTISSSTATAILITTLTTFIGFGSMMIASHRGLQSLGRVFVIGTACCLMTSLIVLPAILALWTRNEKDEPIQRPAADSESKHKRLIRRGV
jgi:predicted RND superfamily exporter protein